MTKQFGKTIKGSIKFVLIFIAFLGVSLIMIPLFLTPPAFLDITIQDKVFETNLDQMEAMVYEHTNNIKHRRKVASYGDDFVIPLGRIESGKSTWSLKIKNFHETTFSLAVQPMERKSIHVSLKPAFGRLRVSASNVLQPTTPIQKKLGIHIDGERKLGINSNGKTIIDVEPGTHNTTIVADGYYPETVSFEVKERQIKDLPIQLAPELTLQEKARIILKWDENPNDLDSHLFLPRNPGLRRRHIYFSNKKISINNNTAAVLDVDDTTSYGPETITIYGPVEGNFKYAVFHYAGTGSISDTSNATIKVITHSEIREFQAPITCNSKWWYVMDLNITQSQTTITSRNTCPPKMTWRTGRKTN